MGVQIQREVPKEPQIEALICHSSPFVGVKVTVHDHRDDFVHIEGWDPTFKDARHPEGKRSTNGDGYVAVTDLVSLGQALIDLAHQLQGTA